MRPQHTRIVPRRVLALVGAMLLLGLPAHAQGGPSSISFDGLGFSFDADIGSSVDVRQVPAQRAADLEGTPETADAPHLSFLVYAKRPESATPRHGERAPVLVRMYPTAQMAGYAAAGQLSQLQALLAQRPDLATFMTIGVEGGGDPLPFMPVMPAPRALQARAAYVDAPAVAGVEYVTAFSFDASPFAAGDFRYTFQGLSADGAWYVAVDSILEASMFPAKVTARQANRLSSQARFARYLSESQAALQTADPAAFDPPIGSLQALVQSLTFGAPLAQGDAPGDAPRAAAPSETAASPAPAASPLPGSAG